MRIIWYSNAPWAASGYGNQTNLFVPRLAKLGHKMAYSAFWGLEGTTIELSGIPVYGKGRTANSYGVPDQSIAMQAKNFKADLIIPLLDIWATSPNFGGGVPVAPWFPIDHEPLQPTIPRVITKMFQPIVFSHFGERMMTDAGIPFEYVPHGVDTNIFKPMDRTEARARHNLPMDKFIVGMVAANQGYPSRKAFKPQMEAFARFHKRHPDTALFIHTDMIAAGLGENLLEFAQQLELTDGSMIFTLPHVYELGLQPEELNSLYNSFDVFMNVAQAEGFGIPILEAQSSGVPVIVGAWTAMEELCFSGWLVPKSGAERWHTAQGSYQFWPLVASIEEQLEAAYVTSVSDRKARGEVARQKALEYDADVVTEQYWKPVLERIEQKMIDQAPKSFEEYLNAAN